MGKKQSAWSGMVSLCERYCCPLTHPLGNLPSLVVLQVILPWILGPPSLDLPVGGPFLQGCVSWFEQPSKGCQYYNDPKQTTSPSPQSHQPFKKKTQIPLPVCNMQPYIPKDFGDIKVDHFKTEKWSSMVELGGPQSSEWKNLHVITSNFPWCSTYHHHQRSSE
jgi:hypothetical protein